VTAPTDEVVTLLEALDLALSGRIRCAFVSSSQEQSRSAPLVPPSRHGIQPSQETVADRDLGSH